MKIMAFASSYLIDSTVGPYAINFDNYTILIGHHPARIALFLKDLQLKPLRHLLSALIHVL